MRTYTRDILEDRRKRLERSRSGGSGDWVALAKFIIVAMVVFGTVAVILHHHSQVKQQMVELNTAIRELKRLNEELEHQAQQRFTELERQSSRDIAKRARAIGLRPARTDQVVRNIPLQWANGSLHPAQEIVKR